MPATGEAVVVRLIDQMEAAVNGVCASAEVQVINIISAAATFFAYSLKQLKSQQARESSLEDGIKKLRQAIYGQCGRW